MKLLLPLASLLGLEVEHLAERWKAQAIVLGTIAFFALIAFVFILVALHAALLREIGPEFAPLAIAGGALLIAFIVWAIAALRQRKVVRSEASKRQASETRALVTTAALTAAPMLLKNPLVRRFGLPLAGAATVAFLLLRSRNDGELD
ncbi:hypothetical protein SAMN02983003_1539 [Devosia enhydra]|uniref:Holin-X, holin superfamily III n=1 Tax=Devosia enhydra TaxID=665118 RepID=A0A1K2HWP5_9HYPH|nr:hypothetical protein [Devosia enhydra]SFZ83249.1 hypothetical protein SAMN02983003_1539 [Devosia enhydra]